MKTDFPVYDICTLSDFKENDILISRFAKYLQVHKNLHQAHKHTFYHLVFFTDGGGSHAIDFQNFEVKPYQIYFMVPGQVHSWSFEGPVDGYVINFSAPFFQSFLLKPDYLEQFAFFNGTLNEAVINLPPEEQQPVMVLFEQLIAESHAKGHMAADKVRALLLQLFIEVSRVSPVEHHSPASYNNTLLKNFKKLVEQNYTSLKLPKDYAALLYITPNHLNALCNNVLGISAGDVVRNRIALEAKRLLVNHTLNVTEIAYQLNFTDNSYFTKFFKKQTGLTPEEFRRETLKQLKK